MAKRANLILLISLITTIVEKPIEGTVSKCYLPCRHLTVKSTEVRDVYVQKCNLNKVSIIGNAMDVKIHSLRGPCEPYRVIEANQSTQHGETQPKPDFTKHKDIFKHDDQEAVDGDVVKHVGLIETQPKPDFTKHKDIFKHDDEEEAVDDDLFDHVGVFGFLAWGVVGTIMFKASIIIIIKLRIRYRQLNESLNLPQDEPQDHPGPPSNDNDQVVNIPPPPPMTPEPAAAESFMTPQTSKPLVHTTNVSDNTRAKKAKRLRI